MKKTKQKWIVEKETIIKEVRGEKLEKVTYRIIFPGDNHNRSIVLSPKDFKDFKKQLLQTN